MQDYRYKYLKYKSKYLNLRDHQRGGTNEQFAEYLSNFMKDNQIPNTDYAVIAGYCVARITGRSVTDLDVIVSDRAFEKLLNSNDPTLVRDTSKISKTPKLLKSTPHGEIEFFGREHTGFPSNEYSLTNLKKNNMLDLDEFNNPYLNTRATIQHYADVKKENGKFILGDGFVITQARLEKNISHLMLINNVIHSNELLEKIKSLQRFIDQN